MGVVALSGSRYARTLLVPLLLIACLVALLVLAVRALGVFVFLELAFYDKLIDIRSRTLKEPSAVVLVGNSEEDLRRWGWPLTDELLDRVLQVILAQNPRAVGIDIYRDIPVPPGTEQLGRSFAQGRQVFGILKVGESSAAAVAAHEAFRKENRAGFADVVVDAGGIVRRGLLYMDHSGQSFQAFPLLLALKYLETADIRPVLGNPETGAMRLGAALIEPLERNSGGYVGVDASGYQFLLDYMRGPSPFQLLTITDVLETKLDTTIFSDKVVIVGGAAESVKDFFYSPFHDRHGKRAVHGVAIHGQVVDQLLRNASGATPVMRAASEPLGIIVIALAALASSVCAFVFRGPIIVWSIAVLGVLAFGTMSWAAFVNFFWFPFFAHSAAWVSGIIAVMSYRSWHEYRERSELMSLFSRHLSPEIAGEIWNRRQELLDKSGQPRSQRLTATILFSDIKGFTTISEALGPREQMDWLNRYMSAMVDVVQQHGGTVNQLIGDCVMAVYGVPIARTSEAQIRQDAVNAVETALAMRAALAVVNDQNKRLRLPEIAIRVGIYTGPVVTGPVGGKDRVQFAIVGDTVNTAARLESLKLEAADTSSEDQCRILVGEDTLNLLGGRYRTVQLGVMALRGKNQPLAVYRVEDVA